MSEFWFNLRVLWFHFQIRNYTWFSWRLSPNKYWHGKWKSKPVQLHACDWSMSRRRK